ncbi:hypothetical protein [Pseudoalteromonas ruthenica]|uniref:hypothetical protein n=1 Tax=Pseudoalteromonas ruthenica TaxID=151081 RepID=UPI00110A7ACA|nr:hypothetical protein [Pseudoalteromonas ruthenica]TMO47876.1 hypothetical protein CWC24_06995 [Pseudoalteromonas ruthenica]TMO52777.1 hypothetical protein CWC23_01890 [Pseudoalteromonas ruthenica]
MGIDIKYLQRIVDEVLKASALKDITWSTLALVLTREDQGFANAGFYYQDDGSATPFYVNSNEHLVLSDMVQDMQQEITRQGPLQIQQLLIQIQQKSGFFKADFEFKNHQRWDFNTTELEPLQALLKPDFSE